MRGRWAVVGAVAVLVQAGAVRAAISLTIDYMETHADAGGYVSSPEQFVFGERVSDVGAGLGWLASDLATNTLTGRGGSSLEASFDGATLIIDARLNNLRAEKTDPQYGGVFAQGQASFQMWLQPRDAVYEFSGTVTQDYSDGLVAAWPQLGRTELELFATLDGAQNTEGGVRGQWYFSGLLTPGDYQWLGDIRAAAVSAGADTGPLSGALTVRADFAPVPTDHLWIGPDGGSFSLPLFWEPVGAPGAGERAIFTSPLDHDETVMFDNSVSNARLLVTGTPGEASSLVVFDLGGHTYELTREWNAVNHGSLLVGDVDAQTRMRIVNGTMQARDAEIGLAGYGEMGVSTDAVYLAPQHMLAVGVYGSGLLDVQNGAWVQHGHGFAGMRPGGEGSINVQGVHPVTPGVASTWWVDGWFGLGAEGGGSLTVSDGALAHAAKCDMGVTPDASGVASIWGTNSRWELTSGSETSLIIGQRGLCNVSVSLGGRLSVAGDLHVAEEASSVGLLQLQQCGTSDGVDKRPTLACGRNLVIGNGGVGQMLMDLEAWAQIQNGVLVGTNPDAEPDFSSWLTVAGLGSVMEILGRTGENSDIGLEVGVQGNGNLMSVESGGWVAVRYGATFGGGAGGGNLRVNGDGSLLDAQYVLEVGRDAPGRATITEGGYVLVSGSTDAAELPETLKGLTYIGIRNTGQLNVIGKGEFGPSTFESSAQIGLGIEENLGQGALNVESGGVVISRRHSSQTYTAGIVGRSAGTTGQATIRDVDSRWEMPDGGLTVGWYGSGQVDVLDGGQLISQHGIVGRVEGALGRVSVGSTKKDTESRWDIGGGLSIGGDLAGAAGGEGWVQIAERGAVYATSAAVVYPGGTLELAGGYLSADGGTTLHGLCTGYGTLFGPVVNVDGMLRLDDLRMAANWDLDANSGYTQQSGGTMQVMVFDPQGAGRLTAWNGAVTLSGRLALMVRPGVTLPAGSTFEIIRAAGGVSGAFTALDVPRINGEPVFEVAYGPNTVTVVAVMDYRCREDFSGDLDVDLEDLALLKACMAGPHVPYAPGCAPCDLNRDGFVDQQDFGIFQRCFGGAGVIVNPGCAG